MSVSLTHVQAALQNQLTSGGSGPLTLNVLHKTDALLSQLKALNHSKPLSVEVLKSHPNGRAEVLTGGLKLDVKASLPLKTGEVLQLKLEQHGSAVRFVQTLGNGQTPPQGKSQGQAQQGTQLNTQLGAQGLSQNSGQQPPNSVGVQGAAQSQNAALIGQQRHVAAKDNSPQTSSDKSHAKGQNSQSQNLTAAQNNARTPASQQSSQPGAQQGTLSHANARQAQQQPAAQEVGQNKPLVQHPSTVQPHGGNPALINTIGAKPGLANVQLSTSALIGVLADVLPAPDKRQAGRTDKLPPYQTSLESKGAKLPSSQGQQVMQGEALANKQMAETVAAKYQTTSSLNVEEIQEVQQRAPAKAPDLTLDLPLAGETKPVHIEFYIGPEPEPAQADSDEEEHGVRFSLETEETGPVHASISLSGQKVRVTLWAEDDEFIAKLTEKRDLLDERMAATGLDLNHLQIRHGAPPTREGQDALHVDANI